MTESTPLSTLLGLPLVLKRVDADQLVNALSQLWKWQMQRPLQTLEEDLDALHRYFDPVATGNRLRTLLANLPPPPTVNARLLREPLVLGQDDLRLITLEGRAVIALLQMLLSSASANTIMIELEVGYPFERNVYERYRQWSLHRITDVLHLQLGKAQSLRLPSIGLLLLLLVNGSHSPQTAMRPFLDKVEREKYVNQVVRTIVAAFCQALDEREHDTRHYVLYGGYPLTEARRRLPTALPLDPEGTYIPPSEVERVLRFIVAELRRPQRSFSKTTVLEAYDQLVAAYRRELPKLAALDITFEQRLETMRIRQRLENLLDNNTRA
jgi:hypothetical protein